MRLAFGHEPNPSEASSPWRRLPRARRAAHYLAAMGLWRPPGSQGAPGPLPTSSCNACMLCADCFLGDVSSQLMCISEVSTQSGYRDQELSADDIPTSVHVDLVYAYVASCACSGAEVYPDLFACDCTCYSDGGIFCADFSKSCTFRRYTWYC